LRFNHAAMTYTLQTAALAALTVLSGLLSSGLSSIGVSSSASAQEYCVTCSEPNAIYRCVLSGARTGLSQSLQVACMTAIATDGRHATCAIKRGVTVFECDGPVKSVAIGPDTAAGEAISATVVPPPAPPPVDPKAPPKTMVEAAQRAQTATDAEMRKAGDATSGFFKRTFTCLGSLFTKCGGN
jgi:hypothetical protein